MNANGLDSRTVISRTGVSLRQLNHWDKLGIVSPSVHPAWGSGSRRRYSTEDVLMLLAARTLREAFVPLEAVREILSVVRGDKIGLDCAPDTILVCTGGRVAYLGRDPRRILAAISAAPIAIIVNIGRLAARAAKLTAPASVPVVLLTTIAGRALQVVVIPRGAGFEAHCNAYPAHRATGPTVEDAVDALRTAIEQASPSKPAGRRTKSRARPASASSGASAWGDAW